MEMWHILDKKTRAGSCDLASFSTFGISTNWPGTIFPGDRVNAALHGDGSQNPDCYEFKTFQSSLTQLSWETKAKQKCDFLRAEKYRTANLPDL